ncbi:response regulator transcription factor [Luteolibacter pohnpeiensis]|uniref:Response regulator transcription factor n=1 Tax=Luteolibacter pohnpeiensis TaxID=454153 RepID=A0A934VPH7_9BACT|nr:LytTR family DNA-binding domain-containing protein [Luteolibacter pohnpeiensis]MBK1881016.1 response regulator transcription factor [Luteolibacter pohnpeiensis]
MPRQPNTMHQPNANSDEAKDSHTERVWRTMIVEDEPAARERLKRLLEKRPEIYLIASTGNPEEAIRLFTQHSPELVFLDIELKKTNGFDILSHLTPMPKVVFVTAHTGYAVKAFEANAIDYLVKPVFPSRLTATLDRLISPGLQKNDSTSCRFPIQDSIVLRHNSSPRQIAVEEINYIEANGNYSKISTPYSTKTIAYRTLSHWEERLPPKRFRRVDRSMIINVSRIKDLVVTERNRTKVYFHDTQNPLLIGRTALLRLQSWLKKV